MTYMPTSPVTNAAEVHVYRGSGYAYGHNVYTSLLSFPVDNKIHSIRMFTKVYKTRVGDGYGYNMGKYISNQAIWVCNNWGNLEHHYLFLNGLNITQYTASGNSWSTHSGSYAEYSHRVNSSAASYQIGPSEIMYIRQYQPLSSGSSTTANISVRGETGIGYYGVALVLVYRKSS
jgi:hypothetical protein